MHNAPMAAPAPPQPGWYRDPRDNAMLRFWDGSVWTKHTTHPPKKPHTRSVTTSRQRNLESKSTVVLVTPNRRFKGVWLLAVAVLVVVAVVGTVAVSPRNTTSNDFVPPEVSTPSTTAPTSTSSTLAPPTTVDVDVAVDVAVTVADLCLNAQNINPLPQSFDPAIADVGSTTLYVDATVTELTRLLALVSTIEQQDPGFAGADPQDTTSTPRSQSLQRQVADEKAVLLYLVYSAENPISLSYPAFDNAVLFLLGVVLQRCPSDI